MAGCRRRIGAGISGVGAGVRLREAGIRDFLIIEAADDFGGTWRANTYPGCQCDVPSRLYIRKAAPRTTVVMLTTFGEEDYVTRALRCGAAGFLLKDTPPDDLIRAVRVAAAGEPVLSPRVTKQLIERYVNRDVSQADEARRRVSALTDRERDVLCLLREGYSNAEIAKSLLIGEGTAKSHVSRILSVLGCTNRVQAAILAHDAGIRPPDSRS
jgi:DNA-binding NarL/FixJ family response regulator